MWFCKNRIPDVVLPTPKDQVQPTKSAALEDVEMFCHQAKTDPNHIVNLVKQHLKPEQVQDLEQQVETFPAAIKDMEAGKLSYAEMRARYG